MFNNNLRKIIASTMLLSVLTGTSLATKIPIHAQGKNQIQNLSHIHLTLPYSKVQEQVNESKANSYFKSALMAIHGNNKSMAQNDLVAAFNYANKISNISSMQSLIVNIIKVQNQLTMSVIK